MELGVFALLVFDCSIPHLKGVGCLGKGYRRPALHSVWGLEARLWCCFHWKFGYGLLFAVLCYVFALVLVFAPGIARMESR